MARAFLVALVLVCAAAAQSSPLVWTGTTQCDFHQCRTGNLTVHIDPDDPSSPKLTLKVAMVHAAAIPAPQGPILLHCGGPGSGKDCALGIAGLYPDLAAQFDFWSIDQRGIGDSEPSLACPKSSWKQLPLPNQTIGAVAISDFTSCDCAQADGTPVADQCFADLDPENQTQVQNLFTRAAERNRRCYNSAQFQIQNRPDTTGSNTRVYNLLDWIGTTYLAHDIDSMRKALQVERMSILGLSYGTSVGAAYASLYPDNIHRLILNGNMPPFSQLSSLAAMTRDAEGTSLRKLLETCGEQPACPLNPNPIGRFDGILTQLRSAAGIAPLTNAGQPFPLSIGLVLGFLQSLLIPGGGHKGSWAKALHYLHLLTQPKSQLAMAAAILDQSCTIQPPDSPSPVITWRLYGVCVSNTQIPDSNSGSFATTTVSGSDYAGRYSTAQALAQIKQATAQMPTIGLSAFVGCFSLASSWGAVPAPLPPYGAVGVKALVIGNLYDPATAYVDSQRMHQGFPSGSLLTWQGVGHCFLRSGRQESQEDSVGFDACEPLMIDYIMNGSLPTNGHVCHSRLDGQFNSSDFNDELGAGGVIELGKLDLIDEVHSYMARLRERTKLIQ